MGSLMTTATTDETIDCNNCINKWSSTKRIKIGNYRLGRSLGGGTHSKIKVAINELSNKRVTMKIFNKKTLNHYRGINEIEILPSLNHPYIRKVYDIIHTKSDIFVALEYMSSGELFDLIVSKTQLVESEARKYFQQIICAMEYCNYKNIVHRDLKPENILLDDNGDIRIHEFQLSTKIKDNCLLKTSCGSPNYAAPEIICEESYIGQIADIWSIGCILYAMLCGRLPFDDESMTALFRKIKSGNFKIPDYVPKDATDLVERMLVVDPVKRIIINEIKQHCWFKKNLPKYLSGEYYEYHDGNELIVGNGNYMELIQQSNSNAFYLPKGVAKLIYRMLDPMIGLINNEAHRIKCLKEVYLKNQQDLTNNS